MQSILNAAFIEICRNPKYYTKTEPKVRELIKWTYGTAWDEPEEEAIMINELPF